tara:strand:+ start:1588 stop:1776 length:189 start_codon:yes stop_codon:yes gene_type:complete
MSAVFACDVCEKQFVSILGQSYIAWTISNNFVTYHLCSETCVARWAILHGAAQTTEIVAVTE